MLVVPWFQWEQPLLVCLRGLTFKVFVLFLNPCRSTSWFQETYRKMEDCELCECEGTIRSCYQHYRGDSCLLNWILTQTHTGCLKVCIDNNGLYNLYKDTFKNDHPKMGSFALIIFEKCFKGVYIKWPTCNFFAPCLLLAETEVSFKMTMW